MNPWGVGGPVVGIDLGTTNSCVAVWKNGRVEIITNSQGNRITPSYVAFKDGDRLIGEAAKNQSVMNPQNTIYDQKRLIGRRWEDSCVQNDMKYWPFKLISGKEDKPMIVICECGKEKLLTSEEISSAVLQKMKETAEEFLGCPVERAVVTVPAYFNDSQRQSTRDAGTIAGLDIMGMINEPTAAALAYGLDSKRSGEANPKKVLIFDLGGGTFDVSILEIKKGDVKVIATGGDTHLGGQDMDTRLVHHFVEEFKRKHKKDITKDPRAMTRLRNKCEAVKRSLTKNSVNDLIVESLFEGIDLVTKLSSAKFESLNMALFEKCMKSVEQCLLDARMSKHSIDDVVLVGGSTRISKLQEMVQNYFGKPPSKSINADEAVAFGAAIKAAKLGEHRDFKMSNEAIVDLLDVIPLSLGTPNYDGVMKVFIKRNTRIPVERVQMWTLTEDFLTSTTFPIYEGEMEEADENHFLGKLKLDGITPLPAYQQSIKVTFCINDDGILKVSSEDIDGGSISATTIDNAGRLGREEMNRMIKEAHDYKLRHQKKKERDNVRCQLERCALDFTHQLDTNSDIPSKSKDKFRETCDNVLEWVQEDDPKVDVVAYRQKKEELEERWENLIQ